MAQTIGVQAHLTICWFFLLIFTYLYDIVLSNEFDEPKLLSFLESAGTELITKEVDPFDEYLYTLGLIPFFVQKNRANFKSLAHSGGFGCVLSH